MTKSRKFILASLLLGGGYCAALFLGGLAEVIAPGSDSEGAATRERGLFATLRDFVPRRDSMTATGQLVPEGQFASSEAVSQSLTPLRTLDRPTWLAATPSVREPAQSILPPQAATAPTLTSSFPIDPTVPEEIASDSQVPPKARITNVVANSENGTARDAPSWDRWPRWDSNVTSSNVSPGIAISPATSRDKGDEQMLAVPAAFHRDVGVRGDSEAENSVERTHIVIDGDSLAKLADRYLDDAALDDEIYRLNRDVLSSPELLPIGVELRIPDRRVAASTHSFASTHTGEATRPRVADGMVPVEWTPRAFDREPKAQLLRPIPNGRSN